jgi:hypothetical protein
VEGEFDIITQSEVRALDGRRRANALYSEDREGEREEGDEEDLVTVGKMVYHELRLVTRHLLKRLACIWRIWKKVYLARLVVIETLLMWKKM